MQANVVHHVTGLFLDDQAAKQAVEKLVGEGFAAEDIGILVADEGGVEGTGVERSTGVAAGVTTGGGLGATLGAVGGVLVSLGTLPAIGFGLAAAGPIAAAVGGAVAGAAGGGLLGTLACLGFWSTEPDLTDDLRGGALLLGVPTTTRERTDDARKVLSAAGAKWVVDRPRQNDMGATGGDTMVS